eukprot:TRINITY_DN574_c0_g2_i1.p1 TRINITY_DN574_c0_g2~~TRINITY_DN574_c0_g2_i1.p1  ORF type:complete len:4319 (+),score=1484.83 TRINITY_DN574_c0_g2_i1:236-13192(+)
MDLSVPKSLAPCQSIVQETIDNYLKELGDPPPEMIKSETPSEAETKNLIQHFKILDIDYEKSIAHMERLVVAVVQKVAGGTEVTYTAPGEDPVDLAVNAPFSRQDMIEHVEKCSGRPFPEKDFLDNTMTARLLELLYGVHVRSFKTPTTLTNFPSIINNSDAEGGLPRRADCVMMGRVVATMTWVALGGKSYTKFTVASGQIANVVTHMSDARLVRAVAPSWARLADTPLGNVPEFLDTIEDELTSWWNDGVDGGEPGHTNQRKASYLLDIMGQEISQMIRAQLTFDEEDPDIWQMPFASAQRLVEQSVQAARKWVRMTEDLTGIHWASNWTGGFHDGEPCAAMAKRLGEILGMRSIVDQLNALMSRAEQIEMAADRCFKPFSFDPLDLNVRYKRRWQNACAEFEKRLEPIERRISSKLRSNLSASFAQPQLMQAEFAKYSHLINRPTIAADLSQEKDNLFAKLDEVIKGVRNDFDARRDRLEDEALAEADRQRQASRNMPGLVNTVVWARQLRRKVEGTKTTAERLLQEHSRLKNLTKEADALSTELKDWEQSLFVNWRDDIKERSQDPKDPLALHMSGSLMELNKRTEKLSVNFSERLVELLREVRQLTSLQFVIPYDIQQLCSSAMKFFRHGIVLKQVAEFYNTMGATLAPYHRAMLYDHASQFESLVTNKKKITWNNPVEATQYVQRLQKAADMLMGEHRRLRRAHDEIGEIVVTLMKTNLVQDEGGWRAGMRDIREKLVNLERLHGYKNMDAWLLFWDYQLYKALEIQWKQGLEMLSEFLAEVKVELVYKEGQVVFRPAFEEIREQYYRRMKDFISLPATFQGLSPTPIFAQMVESNSDSVCTVYANAEVLMQNIQKQRKKFRDYCAVASVDVEEVISTSLSEVHEWEQNFRSIKMKGKEVSMVEAFIKIDCISISTAPIRAVVEEQLQRIGELLGSSLRTATEKQFHVVREFLDKAAEALQMRPSTLDEIGKANQAFTEMTEKKGEMEIEMNAVDAKNKLLRNISGKGFDCAKLREDWDAFVEGLASHERIIAKQIEKMKASVDKSISQFMKDSNKFKVKWDEVKPKGPEQYKDRYECIEKALPIVRENVESFQELQKAFDEVTLQCQYFSVSMPDMTGFNECKADIEANHVMWEEYVKFFQVQDDLANEEWFAFRLKLFRFDDWLKDVGERLGQMEAYPVIVFLRNTIDRYGEFMPLLKFLRGDSWDPEHWMDLFGILGMPRTTKPDALRFKDFLDIYETILSEASELKGLSARAQGEIQIRDAIREVKGWCSESSFSMFKRRERGRTVPLIKDWKELQGSVGDNLSLLSSLKDSPYFGPFADESLALEAKFVLVENFVAQLSSIQRRWIYLEPIFMRNALPSETQRFVKVDTEFVKIMNQTASDPMIISLAKHPEYKPILDMVMDQLERCQRALNLFLEEKRDMFPRFFFIGDDDLLEILGQSKNPIVIQSHLKKLFMGISKVGFDGGQTQINAMKSSEGEVVPLDNPVEVVDDVELWLVALEEEMKATLTAQLAACVSQFDFVAYPSQLLMIAEHVHFTADTEAAVQQNSMPALREALAEKLREYTSGEAMPDRVSELKLQGLIMDLIHNIDVVDQLMKAKVTALTDWQWFKQTRFTVGPDKKCTIRIVDAKFNYSYEYQGNALKLVHTPLTDKCYLTLTQAQHLGYGGNPFGPAGTGKTESVKALGNLFGRQVLVFNCDEGIDFKSMGRIFQGLCKCGAWGCFDEFNRLKPDQLSAVSQDIQAIQASLKKGETSVFVSAKNVSLDLNGGIFVTLNPAGKNYGGRSKLPDNLKQLFRAVAMSVPDILLITETMLYAEGFECATRCAVKLVEVFRLGQQLLSPQQHYDWGLRALKSILRVSGSLVRMEKKVKRQAAKEGRMEEAKIEDMYAFEAEIVIKALRVNTLSKLTFDDANKFNDLCNDVFPGIPVSDTRYPDLEAKIREVLAEFNLKYLDGQLLKLLQLYEATKTRMGVGIVGPSGSGKSTLLRVLRRSLQKSGDRLPWYVCNPKAVARTLLLGYMDNDTREWSDGIVTHASRQVVKEPQNVTSWIVCDGDVDPEWVESLNSVLDDNRLLTMPNGERIQFGDNVNFIFETHNLVFASPATVSRLGLIFLAEEDVDPESRVDAWLLTQPPACQKVLQPLLKEHFMKLVEATRETKKLVVTTTLMGLVNAGLAHLVGCDSPEKFVLGCSRGLGGFLDMADRAEFTRFCWETCSLKNPDGSKPCDVFWDERNKCLSVHVSQATPIKIHDLFSNPIVQTVDVLRAMDVMRPWIAQRRPFLLVGPEGAGKSMLVRAAFEEMKGVTVAEVNCTAQTNAAIIQQKLMQACGLFASGQGRVLKPKDGDRVVLFLKDLNLPKPDMYATVELHSFLQQLLLFEGFYSDSLEWIGVEKVQIIGALNPSGGVGRYDLAERFTAIVSCVAVSYPSRESLELIYGEYMQPVLKMPDIAKDKQFKDGKGYKELAACMVGIYDSMCQKFTLADKSHYLYTPRDLTGWVINLLSYDLTAVTLVEGFYNEAIRIFTDKVVDLEARKAAQGQIFSAISGSYALKEPTPDSGLMLSWLDTGAKKKGKGPKIEARLLQRVAQKDFVKMLEKAVLTYNRDYADLAFPYMNEIYEYVSVVDRIISRPGGSILFCAETGCCRRAVVSIVACQLRFEVVTLNMSKDYSAKNFRADLKQFVLGAGVEGNHTVLVLEDHNFTDNAMLEMVNSLLSSGEVPGLLSAEELAQATSSCAASAAEEGFFGTAYQFFVHRVMKYCHVALIMNPKHPLFGLRSQSNPALFTKCAVVWWGTWSDESLQTLPTQRLEEIVKILCPKTEDADKSKQAYEAWKQMQMQVVKELADDMSYIHQSAGGATPAQLVTMIESFKVVYMLKFSVNKTHTNRFTGGLSKLEDAEKQVATLSKEAGEQKIKLGEKQKAGDKALKEIEKAMGQASEQKTETEALKKKIGKEAEVAEKRQADVNAELSSVAPILQSAKDAVDCINPKDVQEMKALAQPPAAIKAILEGVGSVLGLPDLSWAGIKKFLNQPTALKQIAEFDAQGMSIKARTATEKILKAQADNFKPENAQRASKAAPPLAKWVEANVKYNYVMERIEPLTNEANALSANLAKSRGKLQECEDNLKKLSEKVSDMKKKFAKMTAEAEQLRIGLEKAEEILSGAEALIGKLSGEKGRWVEQVQVLRKVLAGLPALALCSAGYLTYLARCEEQERREKLQVWKDKFKVDATWEFMRFMRGESELLSYKSEGLPADDLSFDNSVIILDSVTTVLVIDPSQQAGAWLRKHLENKAATGQGAVEFTTYNDERFGNALELAVRFGKTLVISEVDRVAPVLFPLVRRELMTKGVSKQVQVGEKRIDFKDTFKLFLLTRDPTLRLPPDAASLLTTVNFSITRGGLEGQLLGVTIQHEKPELEQQKSELLKQEDDAKMELDKLESTLLKELSESTGSLLENKTLIESLNEIKTKSIAISESLAKAKELQVDLDRQREQYRPFARVGSEIFFLMGDLVLVNHMYQFSLNAFVKVFHRALEKEKAATDDVEQKLPKLVHHLRVLAFQYVALSIFKEDRLMFGLHLGHSQFPDICTDDEWTLFTGGKGFAQDYVKEGNKGAPAWCPEENLAQFQAMRCFLPQLEKTLNLAADADGWYRWFKSDEPERKLPPKADSALKPFQKLLVLQAFRPDRLPIGIELFIVQTLDLPSLNPSGVSLADLVEQTSSMEPIILVITTGADPSRDLRDLALQMKGAEGDGFYEVGMGGGMTDLALTSMRSASSSGAWCILKNLHLVVDWVIKLEKELNMLEPDDNFRLWLSTEEHTSFPAVLLRQSMKMTFESPPGMKKNLTRTYEMWTQSFLDTCSLTQAQILFVLAWFHGIMQERRSFIPQGWVKFYEFSFSDLRSSADIIAAQCKLGDVPDWLLIHGLLTEAIYGGPMDVPHDIRILSTFLQQFFNDEMLGLKTEARKVVGEPDPPAKRSRFLLKGVHIPQTKKHGEFVQVFKPLPEVDSPSLFYLPANADKAVQKLRVIRCLDNLSKLKVSGGAIGNKFDRDIWGRKLKPFLALWDQLTKGKEAALLEKPRPTVQGLSPIASFVQLENQTGAGLINSIHRQLSYLQTCIDGSGIMTSEIEKIGVWLLIDETPPQWDKIWEGPEVASNYIRALAYRVDALQKWRASIEKKALLGSPLMLKDVFRPRPLLNALRQETARKAGVPLDELKLDCAWGETATLDGCALSIQVTGCIIQACAIENGKLVELQADSPNFSPVPNFRIGYTLDVKEQDNTVQVPVYLNSSRAYHVMDVPVPCTGGTAKWILMGVGLFFEE